MPTMKTQSWKFGWLCALGCMLAGSDVFAQNSQALTLENLWPTSIPLPGSRGTSVDCSPGITNRSGLGAVPGSCLPCPAPAPNTSGSENPSQTPDSEPSTQQTPNLDFLDRPDRIAQGGDLFSAPMIGDLGITGYATARIVVPGSATSNAKPASPIPNAAPANSNGSSQKAAPASTTIKVTVPIAVLTAMKIMENESPRPMDRVFATTNYFNDVKSPGLNGFDLYRQTIGFEKVILSGDASIGVRLPFLETSGFNGPDQTGIGDMSIVFKYALYNDRSTGNVLSLGTVVTVPTGKSFQTITLDSTNTVYIQPWVGGVYNFDRFYLQGFSSLAVPTDGSQATLLFNSLSLSYRLYQDQTQQAALRYIVPTIEGHLTTPLNHRDFGDPNSTYAFPDVFVLTLGSHFGLFRGLNVTTAVGTPLAGPRPFAVEGVLQLNWYF